jgi:hypothetical protein
MGVYPLYGGIHQILKLLSCLDGKSYASSHQAKLQVSSQAPKAK